MNNSTALVTLSVKTLPVRHQLIFNIVRKMVKENQDRFMKKRSTITIRLYITQFIPNSFDNHSQVVMIYTDFEIPFLK